ncbi:MAG: serine/threonine-protein kinase [Myxococcota bacterium]
MTGDPSEPDPFAFLRGAELEVERGPERSVEARTFSELGPEVVVDEAWRLKTALGHGGFGVVFEAVHEAEGTEAAIKCVAPEPSADERWTLRFEQEAEVAIGLRHPNIVRTRGHGRLADGTRLLVMELLEGETLADRLRAGRGLPWPHIAALVEQLGDALAFVHRAGIVHRDVKPSNVFIAGDPEAVERAILIDFGLCKGPSAMTASREQLGTLPYLAPEVLEHGARRATPAVDVYGLAAVAYEAVTGRRAFPDREVTSLLRNIGAVTRPESVTTTRPDATESLAAAIAQGLVREPDRRPSDAAAYGRALASAIRA